MDVTLFKGSGNRDARERPLFHLRGDGILSRLPGFGRDPLFYQCLTYAASLVPRLALGGYRLVHYSEPALGNILFHLREKLRLRFLLLFSNGVGLSPNHCKRADHLHQLTEPYYEQAAARGIPREKMTVLPYGIHARRFFPSGTKADLRKAHHIPGDKIVVLSVAALNRHHKRIDYLIKEMAMLDERFFLAACGPVEDPSIPRLAEQVLPNRFKFLSVPFEQIPMVYHLADIFVHTALFEGFCLALVEAMCAELPALAHDSPHFRWLLNSSEGLLDMSKPGALAAKIKTLALEIPSRGQALEESRRTAVRRFDWQNLKNGYLAMYERAASAGSLQ